MSITVVGTVATDTITAPKGTMERVLGGSALHFSNAASKLTKVNLVGVVGDDFPQTGYDFFKRKNVDIQGLEVIDGGKSFYWVGEYKAENMNEAITHETHLNVLEQFQPKIPNAYQNSAYLFLANIDPDLQLDVLAKTKVEGLTFLDTMNFWIHSKRDKLIQVMGQVDVMVLNEQEIRDLTGKAMLIPAAREILDKGPTYVVVKKGEYGVALIGKDEYFVVPAYPVEEVVDPTGAGDSFAGGLISYLDHVGNHSFDTFKHAMCYATIVASYYVQGFSVEGLDPITLDDLAKRYQTYQSFTGIGLSLAL
jgi:sugar/nucleoside kinase (ribokinase family)